MSHHLIQVESWVRIVDPRELIRVGYAKTVQTCRPDVEAEFGQIVRKMVCEAYGREGQWTLDHERPASEARAENRILNELAYLRAAKDQFGGSRRDLYFEDRPELAGQEGCVSELLRVVTGVRVPGSGSGEDYQPPYLTEQKVHMIAQLSIPGFGVHEFPVAHLELVKPEEEE